VDTGRLVGITTSTNSVMSTSTKSVSFLLRLGGIIWYYHIILGITIGIKNRFKNKTSLSSSNRLIQIFTVTSETTNYSILIGVTFGVVNPFDGC